MAKNAKKAGFPKELKLVKHSYEPGYYVSFRPRYDSADGREVAVYKLVKVQKVKVTTTLEG